MNRPYLDRAYSGKIFAKKQGDSIRLQKGMLFASVDSFREVLKDYMIQEGFDIVRTRNERDRFTALCAGRGCNRYIHASTNANDVTFEIKVYESEHTCMKNSTNKAATSTWIAKKMANQFKADLNISYETIHEHILSNYGVEVTKSQIYQAKRKAREEVEGSLGKSYSKLRPYAELIK